LEINRAFVDRIHARARLLRVAPRWNGIEGWLSPNEAYALYRYARRLPRGATALEIGSWKGKSTYCIARGLRDGRLICVDPFDASGDDFSAALYTARAGTTSLREQFEATMTAAGVRERLDVRQGTSDRFVGTVGPLDMIFIDGNHEYEACRSDFSGYAPSLRPGGLLLFHDYDPSKPDSGPRMLIDQTIVPSGAYSPIDIVDSLWIGSKAA